MRKLLYTALLGAFAVSGCEKKCETYHTKYNDECVSWASKLSGEWEITYHSVTQNAVGQTMTFTEQQANTLMIDGSLLAQMTDENNYEVPEQTEYGPNGAYQYHAWGSYSETPITSTDPTTGATMIIGHTKQLTFNADNSSFVTNIVLEPKP